MNKHTSGPSPRKARRRGTRRWVTWVPEARVAPMTWYRQRPRGK